MESVVSQSGMQGTGREVFALTDEQIMEMEPQAEVPSDEWRVASGKGMTDEQLLEDAGTSTERGAAENAADGKATAGDAPPREATEQAKEIGAQAPPQWLAERMRDPWHGDEAKELWEGAVQARQEVAAYREAIATPAEARALKELYPGGVSEAKSAAERARQLEEFDAAYFGVAGRPAEALSAARVQLAQRLMDQDPAAFREMVAAGVRLLEGRGQTATGGDGRQDAVGKPRSLDSGLHNGHASAREDNRSKDIAGHNPGAAQTQVSLPPEGANRYLAFEKATNADLEKSVGGAIARAMEQALPNLRSLDRAERNGAAQGTPLQERLGAAVREEVEAALKSDAHLGEQVAKILAARRFEDAIRDQVVRVIDARAQQLVPGAVKRVVGSWTTATLGTTAKSRAPKAGSGESGVGHQNAGQSAPRTGKNRQGPERKESAEPRTPARTVNRGRVDYGKLSDEQILDL